MAVDIGRNPTPFSPEPERLGAGTAKSRRDALEQVRAELAAVAGSVSEPAIATRSYGDGHLAVALAGTFDRAAVERLRVTLRDLGRVATTELVLDLSGLATCSSALARFLAGFRVQRLIDGTRVELHSPPPELASAIGVSPVESFTVRDD